MALALGTGREARKVGVPQPEIAASTLPAGSAPGIRELSRDERGATSIEYVIIVGVVGLALIGSVRAFGHKVASSVDRQAVAIRDLRAPSPMGPGASPGARDPAGGNGVVGPGAETNGRRGDIALRAVPEPRDDQRSHRHHVSRRDREWRGDQWLSILARNDRRYGDDGRAWVPRPARCADTCTAIGSERLHFPT
jgi:Flp pilus assembly pilin Flp